MISLALEFFKSVHCFKYRAIQKFSPPGGTSVPSALYNEGSCPYELTCIGIFQIHPTVQNLERFKIFHHQEALMCLTTIYSKGSCPFELTWVRIFQMHWLWNRCYKILLGWWGSKTLLGVCWGNKILLRAWVTKLDHWRFYKYTFPRISPC